MVLAAIDIGSNAARLLITEVKPDTNGLPVFNKLNLIRVPLRLGFDVFEQKEISKEKIGMILQTMKAYKHLINAYGVSHIKCCATSAMRDASNSADIIRKVKLETDITISVISGDEEANYIYENHIAETLSTEDAYLYIDVGGGSTELTFFSNGKLVFRQSFNIGTIRLLKNLITENDWDSMRAFVKAKTKGYPPVIAIGSGGNINKVFSLLKKKEGKPLSLHLIKDLYKELEQLTVEQRMRLYNLREDRADVIVPALLIYNNVMKWCNADEIYVPRIGLADGLIRHLYDELTKSQL